MGKTYRGHCTRGHRDCTRMDTHDHPDCEMCKIFKESTRTHTQLSAPPKT